MSRVSQRIAAVSESATLAIDAKAKAMKAAGEDVIGFGAGEPDFPTPAHIVEAAAAACHDPKNHKYTPAAGLPELRAAVAAKTARDSGLSVEAGQVLITNGGKQAVEQTFATLLDPGDEVIVPAPFWTTYPESIALAGGRTVVLPTSGETGFKVTVDQLEAARTDLTKILLFVSPSNPAGATFSSMPTLVPDLADTCVVINGVAKTYAMTGWRVGWMIGPGDVIKAAANLQSHATSNVCNVAQRAALAAVSGGLEAVAEMRATYDRRRATILEMLRDIDGVTCVEPEGAFYAFPSFEGVLGRTIGGRTPATTLELAEVVLEEAKVAFVPGEAFGAPGYARFSYALADDAMVEGVSRIAKLLS